MAWRIKLSPWMRRNMHINTIEFTAATIGLWLEIIMNEKTEYLRINCLTDNSSAVGWLFKANFNPDTKQKHDMIARRMATVLLKSESALYPQHIPGEENIVADSLSRDFHIPDKHLQLLLTSLFPRQAPKNLTILNRLPRKITSWLESLQDSRISASEFAKQNGCFDRWERFLECAGIQDKFLDTYAQDAQISIMSAFAAAVRRNEQGRAKLTRLMGGSVSQTVHNVCSVFRTNLRKSPMVDENGKTSLAITRQLKGYIADDPATTHQKCLPNYSI